MNDPLEALRRAFLDRCRSQLRTLDGLACSVDLAADPGDHEKLVKAVHSLSGAGGTFGFSDLSTCACRLEELLVEEGGIEPIAIRVALESLIAELKRITR